MSGKATHTCLNPGQGHTNFADLAHHAAIELYQQKPNIYLLQLFKQLCQMLKQVKGKELFSVASNLVSKLTKEEFSHISKMGTATLTCSPWPAEKCFDSRWAHPLQGLCS